MNTRLSRIKAFFTRRQMKKQMTDFIETAYQVVLNRSADPEGMASYAKRLCTDLTPGDLLRELAQSEEKQMIDTADGNSFINKDLHCLVPSEAFSFGAQMAACTAINRNDYERLWQNIFSAGKPLVIGQAEYGRQHKERFWQLCNAIGLLLAGCGSHPPRLLECGVSEFSAMYPQLFPGLLVDTLDRPVQPDYIGFTPAVCRDITGCRNHFEIDLEQPHHLEQVRAICPQGYNVIVFAEVFEHLVVNPIELISWLLSILAPSGYLYLSTPNFFRDENLDLLRQGENPQQVFPGQAENWDAHFHFREYGLKEMCRFIMEAGGTISGFYYFGTADVPKSTLVFAIQRA